MYFHRCIDFVDIARHSCARGRQLQYTGRKWQATHCWDAAVHCYNILGFDSCLACLQLVFTSNGSNFGMLSRRADFWATAGLSCFFSKVQWNLWLMTWVEWNEWLMTGDKNAVILNVSVSTEEPKSSDVRKCKWQEIRLIIIDRTNHRSCLKFHEITRKC